MGRKGDVPNRQYTLEYKIEAVRLAESPAVGLDIFRHAPESRGAEDYAAFCDELVSAGFLN